ncbi:hypothetical protein KSP40_PGU015806 [Platanthera guangdongensis]|uniref:Uncharacterized protein n=1 Tax=Platanthera guangdongensis TaxID=2320717 RepID=A0ABR2M4Z4_9ASPA
MRRLLHTSLTCCNPRRHFVQCMLANHIQVEIGSTAGHSKSERPSEISNLDGIEMDNETEGLAWQRIPVPSMAETCT